QRPILADMTLCWGDVADTTVPVFVVVPLHKPNRPLPRGVEVGKAFGRELRPILHGAKQRLGKGIVIAHPWPRVGRLDAEPVQHRQHRRGFQSSAIVGMAWMPSARAVRLARCAAWSALSVSCTSKPTILRL